MPEMQKLDKDRDVRKASAEALWYDDAILHYRYHKLRTAGQRYEGWTAEDIVNLHVRIVQELRRRGLPHFDRDDELDRDSKPFLKEYAGDYANVRPSGNRMGEPVTLDDVLPHLRTFKLRQPYVYLVGGLVVHGKTEGDIDILVKDSEALPPEFRHVLEWRIMRALPEKLWERVQFHYDHFHGPFTDNVPVFDLTVERANDENQVFRMDEDAGDLVKGMPRDEALAFLRWADAKAEAPRAGTPEVARQAEDSRSEDRIELFRYFVPMKPVRGYFPEERQTLDRFLSLFGPEDFPIHSTRKFDGANCEIHRSGDHVAMFSEDGGENTERFPGIVEAVRKLRWRDLVLLAEIEIWRGGKHLPREAVTGYIHGKGEPDDSELVANVYDVVYAAGGPKTEGLDEDAGDIHSLPFAKRERYLEALGIVQAATEAPDLKEKLNRVTSLVSRNLDELRDHTERLAGMPGAEGNVAKTAAKSYSLSGRSEAQIKFHNSAVLAGVIIERIKTKVPGVYNYRYAVLPGEHDPHEDVAVELDDRTYLEVGKTFSTARRAARGQVIEVEFETLNLVRHPDGTFAVTAWAPRVMRIVEDRKEPDTVEAAVAAAKAGRVFQEKEVTPEGETVYLAAGTTADDDVEKSNYLGSKRRLAKDIVDKFPEDGKTVFDPMCGVSGVLIEAARRGCKVRGNDLSVVPYWYSKGVFEGAPFSEAEVEKLAGASPHDGWLTREWKGEYPRPRALRRYLDGLANLAREWKGPKGWTAKAAVSAVVQTLYSESGSGYSTRRYESLDKVRAVVRRAVKEVSGLVAEVAGRGTITNEDAQAMCFPRADVVYFDPPYFKRDKGAVHYFQSYRVSNSILLGREWKEANLKPEDIPPILERLCRNARHIFVSTSSNEVLPYAKELARHKRTMKRYRLSYRQTSGFGSRDEEQHQNLFVAKAGELEKQADPYMRLPDEEKTHRYVVQEHSRGRSMHADFRIESVGNKDLIGWTLNTLIAGAIKEPVTTLSEAKALKSADYSKINWDTGEFKKRRKRGATALVNIEVNCQRKPVEPHPWIDIEGVVRRGEVGASKEYPGVFNVVDKGVCEYGCMPPDHLVFTHSGMRPIGEVEVGDHVLGASKQFVKVLTTFRRPASELMRITVRGGFHLSLTPNHPVLVARPPSQKQIYNRRKKLCDVVPEPKWVPAGELKKRDFVALPRFTQEGQIDMPLDGSRMAVDAEIAWLIGLFIADGHASKCETFQSSFSLSDRKHVDRVVDIATRKFGAGTSIQRRQGHWVASINNADLWRALRSMTYANDGKKIIPPGFLWAKRDVVLGLLEGVYAGDGGKTSPVQLRLSTTSPHVFAMTHLLLAKLGVAAGGYRSKNAHVYCIDWLKRRLDLLDHAEPQDYLRRHDSLADRDLFYLPVREVSREPYAGEVCNLETADNTILTPLVTHNSQKLWLHEYFPSSGKQQGGFRYRVFFRQLRVADIQREDEAKALSRALLEEYLAHDPDIAREDWDEGYWEFLKAKGEVVLPAAETKFREEAAWLLIKPIDQTPYVLSDRAVEAGWVPPKGFSALPKAVRSKVPTAYRYWQMEREAERREMRDALVKAVAEGDVTLPGVEKAAGPRADEFEKRKLTPFNQWGGSAKYAKRLARKLPEHARYVEPFCGAAAVLFVKDRADEEVLADIDADIVFTLKYIQKLTPARFEEIKRLNWTVSRAGFKRVRECEPRSDSERFWKFVYWRLCSWGGIPRSTGFSTLHAGQTYVLDDLWKFHERLKGVRIVRRDWKETLRECDGKGTLFFIDPPYVEEWGAGGKARGAAIPPEDIAEGVRSLKGRYVIAYTDSARARRALSKVGHIFKMRFLEARHHGLWSKRSRLFVASFDIKKSGLLEGADGADDIEWIKAAEGSARFVLQYHYFRKRGEKPVRSGPTTWHWDLRIDAGEKTLRHWTLDHDITQANETVGYFKRDPDKRALEAEGFYPPGSYMNPTKDTPSFVEILDKGECRLLVDQPGLVKVQFEGKKLRNVWLLEKKNSNWHVRRVQAAPAAKAEEAVACSL